MSWAAANASCTSWSINGVVAGSLASVGSPDENAFIYGLTTTPTVKWLGGYKLMTAGAIYWTDGTPFSFSYFNQGEPSNTTLGNGQGKAENCIRMGQKSATDQSKWNDAVCTTTSTFVCKRALPAGLHRGKHITRIIRSAAYCDPV